MPASSRPALPERERAQVLVEFLAVRGLRLAFDDAIKIAAAIPDGTDRTVSDAVRAELAERGIRIKHMHGLQLAARLEGRASFYAKGAQSAFGYISAEGKDVESFGSMSDAEKRLFADVQALADKRQGPFVLRVMRKSDQLWVSEYGEAWAPTSALVLNDAKGRAEWDRYLSGLLTRLRHQVEEVRHGLLDGYVCARHGHVEADRCSDLVALVGEPGLQEHNGLEAGRGTELSVFSGIERLLEKPFENAVVRAADAMSPAYITVGDRPFTLQFEIVDVDGRIELKVKELTEDDLNALLRRYRRTRASFGPDFLKQQRFNQYFFPSKPGAPTARLDLQAVDERLRKRGQSRAWLAEELGVPLTSLGDILELGPVVRACQLLSPDDFNQLIRRPVRANAGYATEALLRPALLAVDEVRFVLPANLRNEVKSKLRDIGDALHASHRVRLLTQAGALKLEGAPPLHEGFYATDGAEFLDRLAEAGFVARIASEPMFIHNENLPTPAVGRRLVLFIEPSPVASSQAAS